MKAGPQVLGYDVMKQADAVRRRIGLAGQYAAVDANLTGRENLQMVGVLSQMQNKEIAPRAAELLGAFDLTDAADRPVRTYSGGMRRRLDIAASLVHRPPILFLDEPTTGLDITSRNALWDMIRDLVDHGTTVLLTTQYLEEADQLASRIAVVDGGKVIANDTPVALKADLGSTVVEMEMSDAQVADTRRADRHRPLRGPRGVRGIVGADRIRPRRARAGRGPPRARRRAPRAGHARRP